MISRILLFCSLLLSLSFTVSAQTSGNVYTEGSRINIRIEGTDLLYEYYSNNLMVRLDDQKDWVECVLFVNTLQPLNPSSPTALANDVFFESKYPRFVIRIVAPTNQLNKDTQQPLELVQPGRVIFQGRWRELTVPVVFTPSEDSFSFRAAFDFSIQDMEGTVPRKYRGMLTGRIYVEIINGFWVRPLTDGVQR